MYHIQGANCKWLVDAEDGIEERGYLLEKSEAVGGGDALIAVFEIGKIAALLDLAADGIGLAEVGAGDEAEKLECVFHGDHGREGAVGLEPSGGEFGEGRGLPVEVGGIDTLGKEAAVDGDFEGAVGAEDGVGGVAGGEAAVGIGESVDGEPEGGVADALGPAFRTLLDLGGEGGRF